MCTFVFVMPSHKAPTSQLLLQGTATIHCPPLLCLFLLLMAPDHCEVLGSPYPGPLRCRGLSAARQGSRDPGGHCSGAYQLILLESRELGFRPCELGHRGAKPPVLPEGTRPISLLSAGGVYLLRAVRCMLDHQCSRLWGSSRQDSEPVSIYCQSLRETMCNLGTESDAAAATVWDTFWGPPVPETT